MVKCASTLFFMAEWGGIYRVKEGTTWQTSGVASPLQSPRGYVRAKVSKLVRKLRGEGRLLQAEVLYFHFH